MPSKTPEAIGERHNLRAGEISPLKDVGIVTAIRKESAAVPAARAAGVRTPALVAFDDSFELLPVPYVIYERVHGKTLGMLHFGPEDIPGVWHQVGRGP